MRKATLFAIASLCMLSTFAQADSTSRNERLRKLADEIHNLTREPLGEGDLILSHWIEFSHTSKGQTKISRVHFSATDSSIAWTDDITNTRSLFFRKSSNSNIYSIIPGSNQGTTLTDDLMKALGYNNEASTILYTADKKAEPELITGRNCFPSVDDSTTVWIAHKSELKKSERFVVKRGVEVWASNQTMHSQIRGLQTEDSDYALGFNYDGIEIRVIDFGVEGDFALALDKIMVNIPGKDLKTIADERAAKKQTD